jgi:hypothetical protein
VATDKNACEQRGCLYDDSKPADGIPICYLDKSKVGYKRITDVKETDTGFEIGLQLKGSAKNTLKYSEQIENLKLEVTYLTDRILRFKLLDTNNTRFEVPFQKDFPLLQNKIKKSSDSDRFYKVEISSSKDDFSFSVIRRATKTKL